MRRRFDRVAWLGLGVVLTAACAGPLPARADSEASAMNRVRFHVERSRKVANDRITAIVGVTDEDSDAARLADRVNQAMTWATAIAKKKSPAVEAQSGSYQTYPVHEDGKIRRWRASQDLVLTSGDIDLLTALIGELQSRLLVRSIAFGVSTERTRAVQDELITECLAAYQERADRIRKGLSARGYALVDLSIDTPSRAPGPYIARLQESFASVAQPALEAGESELSVRIDATIELEK